MTAVASPAPAAPIRVAAGTTAGAAVREAGLPQRGEVDAIVVVKDADGRLRDLSWTPEVDVEVIPGVTASLAVSAILGAPLGHDHATISLSDLHTPWNVIERRLQAIAEGDFVVALYNPRSRKRTMHLPRALEILGARRPPETPVAVVQDATRPGENFRVAPISVFDPEWVDMHSIVIVGSSTTRMVPTGVGAEVMVTPRDYKWLEER